MQPTNPNFGTGFPEQAFRDAIRSTMQMGMPNSEQERATFRWAALSTFQNPNVAGRPINFNDQALTIDRHEDVQVDCAVEFVDRAGNGTAIGEFNNPRAKVYVMDDDYELIKTATSVLLGGNEYTINFTEPPVSLFKFTLYTLHVMAVDES